MSSSHSGFWCLVETLSVVVSCSLKAGAAMVVETAVMGVTEATAAVEDIRVEEEEDTPLEEAEATTETGVCYCRYTCDRIMSSDCNQNHKL